LVSLGDPVEMEMSLKQAMATGRVRNLDLSGFITVDEETPIQDVLRLMRNYDRTTSLVTRGGKLSGIFTERDVLQRVVSNPETWEHPVRRWMTPSPTTISPECEVFEAVRLMNAGHFRDIPVVTEDGTVVGNLTDNAVVRHLCEHLQVEVLNLPPNPGQILRTPEGA
jgi:CBS domain-containing protein